MKSVFGNVSDVRSAQPASHTGICCCTKLGDPTGDPLGILGGSMSEEGDPVAIMTHKNGGIQLVNFPLI